MRRPRQWIAVCPVHGAVLHYVGVPALTVCPLINDVATTLYCGRALSYYRETKPRKR